ncbi:MAG: hypothetical protein WB870_03400 [Gallionellaceae bacterium]
MSFALDMSNYQTVGDVIGAGHGKEIFLLGRVLEIFEFDLASLHQLSLPLVLTMKWCAA